MLTCNLMGGLGNQLFQIFATISYAIKSNNNFAFLNVESLGGGGTTKRYTYWDSFLNRLAPFLKNSFPQIVTVVKEVPTGLNPDKVISFLIDENVEPDTIVKMIADLEISSGTLMAELCKYMTKKTLEKQATWRPTGYNTAKAQMSTKN